MKVKIIISFSIILIIFGKKLKCGNGLVNTNHKEPVILKGNNEVKRRVLDNEFKQMKIKVDYTQLKIDTKENEEIFEIIKTSLDLAVHYFELLLSVQHDNTIDSYSNNFFENACGIDNVDENCSNWFKEYDLLILPSLDSKLII